MPEAAGGRHHAADETAQQWAAAPRQGAIVRQRPAAEPILVESAAVNKPKL